MNSDGIVARLIRKNLDDESDDSPLVLDEASFKKLLRHERRRTERSGHPFALMLVDLTGLFPARKSGQLAAIAAAVSSATRETDITGWYEHNSVVGAIFTALEGVRDGVGKAIQEKVRRALASVIGQRDLANVVITVHFFPEDNGRLEQVTKAKVQRAFELAGRSNPEKTASDEKLYPDLDDKGATLSTVAKRCIDVLGSLVLLVLLAPVFALVALMVKLSSKGPILFRQQRLGQFGREFTFMKFRSMYVGNDSAVHKKFVLDFIAGKDPTNGNAAKAHRPYKITNDPRITPIGRFLRKSSLDELPQLLSVLRGDMSLVGPRPPVPYEYAKYGVWHRRRVLEAKPGITGLWQVHGRSRTTFDEMVRLDLQYVRDWSLWLDLKILCMTPVAVLSGDGAY
jgi:lipopolysaccharide/colanic/teichoic acid biosynthesis glycosyltransferase